MQEIIIKQNNISSVLMAMSNQLLSKYVIITDWEENYYISYPNDDNFKKTRGRLFMSRTFLPSMIDFEDGWFMFYTDTLEEALEEFSEKFPNPY